MFKEIFVLVFSYMKKRMIINDDFGCVKLYKLILFFVNLLME